MLRNRRHDEHKDHERGDRFERTDKKTTEDAKESKRTRDPHRDRDTDEQADDDLSDQAQFVPTIDDVFHNATYCASICIEQIGEKVISYVRDQRPCLFILSESLFSCKATKGPARPYTGRSRISVSEYLISFPY